MAKHTYEESHNIALNYFNGEEISTSVYLNKYAMRDFDGDIVEPTPDLMHTRLASEFSRIDENYDESIDPVKNTEMYFAAMKDFARIVPQGSVMAAVGNPYQTMSASNCVVEASPEDSISGIFRTAHNLAQLYKRRCVAASSLVVTKEHGIIPIENVLPGMYILSYDIDNRKSVYNKVLEKFESDVEKDNRIIIRYSNGTELRTSKKHPVLEFGEHGFGYIDAGKLRLGSVNVRPAVLDLSSLNVGDWDGDTTHEHELAWFVGAHIGNGSADRVITGDDRGRYERIRLRISGDNKEVVEQYKNVHNYMTKNSAECHESYRTDYQTLCWEFSSSAKANDDITNELLDNQIGSKTYSARIPNSIDNDFKMWSFIAGLIDTDGTVKEDGQQIVIGICAKLVINEIAAFLQSKGVSTHLIVRDDVRENEQTIYQLGIHYDKKLWDGIALRLYHDEKRSALWAYDGRSHSLRKPITQNEYNHILRTYAEIDKDWSDPNIKLLAANIYYLKKSDIRGVGRAFLNQLVVLGFLSPDEAANIMSRVSVVEIVQDTESNTYYDLEVENTNNFYCGNGGLVVIHNCGVGFDLSTLRPDGLPVNNAARTTTGAWSFADFFSDVTRKIGQCIAKGERVLTQNGLLPIEDVKPGIDSVWTKNGFVGVSNLFTNGLKKIYKLQTSYGFSVRASEDHLFLTEEDGVLVEKRLGDFEEGDSVVLIPGAWRLFGISSDLIYPEYIKKQHNNSNRLNEDVTIPRTLTNELAYILGMMYGDGGVEYDKFNEPLLVSMACAHEHPAVQQRIVSLVESVFGIKASVRPGDGAVNKVTINSKLICHWLEANSLLKEKSTRIRVPYHILMASSEIQMSFLAGFFDADGTNGKSKKGYSFSTTSFSFAKDIQIMLMANGIISKIHTEDRTSKDWNDLYSVAITGTHAQEALVACIDGGTFPAAKIYERFISKRDNYTTPYKAKSLGVTHNHYDFIPDNSHYVSATSYLKIKSAGEKAAQSGLLIKASVSSITEEGFEETFDLELPEEHLFWCEGFYVHNSGRRGALMITLDVHHPDVVKFTNMKHDLTQVTGANISLRLSDEFLKAVEDGTDYEVRWPCESKTPKISRKVSARRVWDAIVDSATKSAEPGLVLWNNAVRTLPAHCYPRFKSVSTNPCSEIILSASDSCRLISLNLTNYVNNPFEGSAHFDFERFTADVALQARMGDNLVDLEIELLKKIIKVIAETGTTPADICEEVAIWEKLLAAGRDGRRTGLGTHGLADTLAQLRIRYDSDSAIEMVDKIYRVFKETAYRTSVELAKTRGAFPAFDWELEKDNPFIQDLPADLLEDMAKYGRRNISMLTQAPTGSVAIISKLGNFAYFNVSSGVEPVFRVFFVRRKKVNPNDVGVHVDFTDANGDSWQEYKQFSNNAKAYLEKLGLDESSPLPDFFVNSDEVDWTKRIQIQAAEQRHIDHSISSTINLPAGTPNEVVGKIYMEAWKYGLKGVTVYVDGSRDGVLVTGDKQALKVENYLIGHYSRVFDKEGFEMWDAIATKLEEVGKALKKAAKAKSDAQGDFDWETADSIELPSYTKQDVLSWFTPIFDAPGQAFAPKREKILDSETHKIRIDFGNGEPRNAYVTVSFFPNSRKPYEVLVIAPYFGLEEKDLQILELTARTTSMNLRHGVPIPFICEQLDKIGGQYIFSLPTNIARVLRTYIGEQQDEEEKVATIDDFDRKNAVPLEKCPSCGKRTYRKTGAACGNCTDEACAYSGCG